MTRLTRLALCGPLLSAAIAACGAAPDYPADWSPLQPPRLELPGGSCPDLSGDYALPPTIKARVRREPAQMVYPHRFLTAVAGVDETGRMSSAPRPTRLRLDGPAAEGLTVTFFDAHDTPISTHRLVAGIDFACRGSWIADPAPSQQRAKPTRFYGKDIDGRLIGHTEYAGAGVVFILGIIPLPTYSDDASWWRLEPAAAGRR